MSLLDTTIVNVALATLARDLHAPVATIQWVSAGYLVSLALVIPLAGWLVERFGTTRVWMLAVAGFGAGSALCGVAGSAGWLIFFRVLPEGRARTRDPCAPDDTQQRCTPRRWPPCAYAPAMPSPVTASTTTASASSPTGQLPSGFRSDDPTTRSSSLAIGLCVDDCAPSLMNGEVLRARQGQPTACRFASGDEQVVLVSSGGGPASTWARYWDAAHRGDVATRSSLTGSDSGAWLHTFRSA